MSATDVRGFSPPNSKATESKVKPQRSSPTTMFEGIDARRLTPAQSECRRATLSAARTLATEGGFDSVSISAVAEKAGVSRATLYRYFGSKAQLLAELTVELADDLTASLEFESREGVSAEKRVAALLERIVDWALFEPKLFEALARGWTSPNADHPTIHRLFYRRMHEYVLASVGGEKTGDSNLAFGRTEQVASLLGHVMFSCLVQINSGIATRDEAKSDLRLAAGLLLETR